MSQELLNLTAYELAKKIEAHEVSAREAAEVANARLEEAEGDVHAFVTVTPELAVERAERVDARMKNGGVKLWEGCPGALGGAGRRGPPGGGVGGPGARIPAVGWGTPPLCAALWASSRP